MPRIRPSPGRWARTSRERSPSSSTSPPFRSRSCTRRSPAPCTCWWPRSGWPPTGASRSSSTKRRRRPMDPEKIKVRVTETGQTLDVVVYSKRAERIEIVLGEGIHNVKCELTPTRMGLSYAGSVRGRELVYERSREQVQADLDKLNPKLREPRRR